MQQLKVDEVPNNVIRVLCFRDELPGEWTDFIGHPVKYIMDNTDSFSAQVGNESTVIDVWDRQFVNLRMERRQPKFADTFIVLIRVTGISIEQVLTRSGQHALYYMNLVAKMAGHLMNLTGWCGSRGLKSRMQWLHNRHPNSGHV